ncbi:hypothetical protein CALCODRAFT_484252 [Calocera cornea HHB12733]|uniref:Uncharacterized protein n=1 Tax=Calocera cornea HHB12733 TaxID=1353952 RepID=A0A165F278_9BASI|nr:hypothetical protein CALCODRAFT_484252 [Calocera cornea HHB12733]
MTIDDTEVVPHTTDELQATTGEKDKDAEHDAAASAFKSDDEEGQPSGPFRKAKRKRASVRKKNRRREAAQADAASPSNTSHTPFTRVRVRILKDPRRSLWGILGQPIVLLHWTNLNAKDLALPQYTAAMGQAGWHDIEPVEISEDKFVREFVLKVGWVKYNGEKFDWLIGR